MKNGNKASNWEIMRLAPNLVTELWPYAVVCRPVQKMSYAIQVSVMYVLYVMY